MAFKHNHKMRKYGCVAVLLLCAAVLLAFLGGSFYLLDYALQPEGYRDATARERLRDFRESHPIARAWTDSVVQTKALRDTTIVLANGLRSHALYLRNPRAKGRAAVVVHGYTDSAIGMLQIGMLYDRLGYSVLLPDLPAHGDSEGETIGMGWNDRLVVERWIGVADSLFRNTAEGHARLVVHGISMGAATTMCVSGDNPPQVNCYVEDCGYTSVWDQFAKELRERFSLPAFPLLYMASGINKLLGGWSFGEASPLSQVAKCRKPMLFIHGDADTYVPTRMVFPLYEAKTGAKRLWIARGSAHARSFDDHPAEYSRRVKAFVEEYNDGKLKD